MALNEFISEKLQQADTQLNKAWAVLDVANKHLANILQNTGELALPQSASYIYFDGGAIKRGWANKARCLYGLRIEVLLEDGESDNWHDLSNNETFFCDNLFSLLSAMELAL